MNNFTIQVENDVVRDAFVNFLFNYKEHVVDYINKLVGNDGSPIDSGIAIENNQVTIYHIAPDKGFVMGETPDGSELPVQIAKYTDLADGKRYIIQDRDRLTLYYKQPTGQVDFVLGSFKTLNDAIKGFNTQPVLDKMQEVETIKKARDKDLRRMKKLGKLTEEDSSQIEEAQVVTANE